MNLKEWAKREVELAKLAEYENPNTIIKATTDETEKARAIAEIENSYSESVYDAALEVFDKLCEQNHSGLSINLTMTVLTKLVKGHALTPLQGTYDEWSEYEDWGGEDLMAQNQRNSAVFKCINKTTGTARITYTDILNVVNESEVWHTYPPYDEPGTLDDNFLATKKYFDQLHQLKLELEAKIVFPYSPITYHYKWNFRTLVLEEEE